MPEQLDVKVIDLGGSIIAPDKVDVSFLKKFYKTIKAFLDAKDSRRVILVCGGGSLARGYQAAYRELAEKPEMDEQDWIGIAATRLNAELLKRIFARYCPLPVVLDPTDVAVFAGKVLVAGGWKPGFSTDYDAVVLAERFSSNTVINLSNISKVYTDDPKNNPKATPLDRITWAEYRSLAGEQWRPGINAPFDPIAAKLAAEKKISVIVSDGRNIANLKQILSDQSFIGTVIGPE